MFSSNSNKISFDLKGSLINRFNKFEVRNIKNHNLKKKYQSYPHIRYT